MQITRVVRPQYCVHTPMQSYGVQLKWATHWQTFALCMLAWLGRNGRGMVFNLKCCTHFLPITASRLAPMD
jgi:hypothetical protein